MNNPNRIELLIVDDDDEFRDSVVRRFVRRGYPVQEANCAEKALLLLETKSYDVALLDMVMPDLSGIELLKKIKEGQHECEVVLLTGQGTIQTAVEAIKLGAYDYLTKPFPLAELEIVVEKAAEHFRLRKENIRLRTFFHRIRQSEEMIGESLAMQQVFRMIGRAGPTDKAILIQGESGTGKELVARALHSQSTRAENPMVIINCAALPEALLESELFGHEKGSFTGALAAKPGLFEMADGGTLFIDEIGELAGSLQAKLLRVLEDGSMRRVGSLKERRVDVRLLVATNRNMADEVEAGRFREDLYYRINVMSLELPPLRERSGDIGLLVKHFLAPDWKIEDEALRLLENYHWPGNIRQLINAIERAKIMSDTKMIRSRELPREILKSEEYSKRPIAQTHDDLAMIQCSHVIEVLRREGGNKARTARALGINRRSLYRLLEKYGIHSDGKSQPS